MSLLVVAPVLLPLATAAAGLFARNAPRARRALGVGGALALLGVSIALLAVVDRRGILCVQLGGWPAPFGVSWVADRFGAIMTVLGGLIGTATAVYSLATVDAGREAQGYYALVHLLLAGVSGAFLTGDLFNLFVWFELLLIASFVLLALGGERRQLEGAIAYVTLNLIASAVFLSAVGLLYGMTGTLNLADLSLKVRALGAPPALSAVSMLFLVAFGIKAALFPLFFWLPAAYPAPPVAVAALFAGLLTKVGVYALIRVFTLVFTTETAFTHAVILGLSVATMLAGVLGALAQHDLRRILSFHIISQIGYMTLGLGFYSLLGLAGSVFYIGHHIVVKANLFLLAGLARKLGGSFDLERLGGLGARHPALGALFLVPALSLAGVPPLSGFFAKFVLVRAGLELGAYGATAVALAVGLMTLLSMTKIWSEAFWRPAPAAAGEGKRPGTSMLLPVVALAALTLSMGLLAGPFLALAFRAAEELMDPTAYVRAVLGG